MPSPFFLTRALQIRARLYIALAICAATIGCVSPFSPQRDERVRVEREQFGVSTNGLPIRGTILSLEEPARDRETYLLLGVVHGNEPLGGPILERFIAEVRADPALLRGRRFVVVPVVNPDGLARGQRTNVRGVDLNRNFPAENWTPARRHGLYPGSEPETRTVLKLMRQFRPARILAIHSPLHCVNYDGPAREIAEAMARATKYPLRASIGYPTPGSLGSYAGIDLDTPTVTLELRHGLSRSRAWNEAYPGLVAFVRATPRAALAAALR